MWSRALKPFLTSVDFKTEDSLDNAEPELCVTLFQRGLKFSGMKHRLRSADQNWMESFLEQGGLLAIFEALQTLGDTTVDSLTSAMKQLDCVACIRAVLNSQVGLNFIIHYPDSKLILKLSEGEYAKYKLKGTVDWTTILIL